MIDNTRTGVAFPEDKLRLHLGKLFGQPSTSLLNPFQFGQVVEVDSKNRIKVRVPLLDDVLEDSELPWCLTTHSRVVDTPEVNSAVIIGIWDPRKPTVRFWLSSISDDTLTDLFEPKALSEELDNNQKIWNNISLLTQRNFGHFPGEKGRPFIPAKLKKINYKVGVRGKGKNSLEFDKDSASLIQNKGEKNESKLKLSKKAELLSQDIDILTTLSKLRHKPVFADPLFSYLDQQSSLLELIVTVLTTTPALFSGAPCIASPTAVPLSSMKQALNAKLKELKIKGKSDHIQIN